MKAFKPSPRNKIESKFPGMIEREVSDSGVISIYLKTQSGRMLLGTGKDEESVCKSGMAAAGVK